MKTTNQILLLFAVFNTTFTYAQVGTYQLEGNVMTVHALSQDDTSTTHNTTT